MRETGSLRRRSNLTQFHIDEVIRNNLYLCSPWPSWTLCMLELYVLLLDEANSSEMVALGLSTKTLENLWCFWGDTMVCFWFINLGLVIWFSNLSASSYYLYEFASSWLRIAQLEPGTWICWNVIFNNLVASNSFFGVNAPNCTSVCFENWMISQWCHKTTDSSMLYSKTDSQV